MANFNSEFKKILKRLEENISDKENLDIAKVEMFNLYNLFFDEITNLEQKMNKKMEDIAQNQIKVEETLEKMGKTLKNIEKDIYMDDEMDDEEYDVEIKCPYCNETFTISMDQITESEITCPECNNTIELDWGHDCECGCDGNSCDCCSHDDHNCKDDDDDDM